MKKKKKFGQLNKNKNNIKLPKDRYKRNRVLSNVTTGSDMYSYGIFHIFFLFFLYHFYCGNVFKKLEKL